MQQAQASAVRRVRMHRTHFGDGAAPSPAIRPGANGRRLRRAPAPAIRPGADGTPAATSTPDESPSSGPPLGATKRSAPSAQRVPHAAGSASGDSIGSRVAGRMAPRRLVDRAAARPERPQAGFRTNRTYVCNGALGLLSCRDWPFGVSACRRAPVVVIAGGATFQFEASHESSLKGCACPLWRHS